jgi:hypothetical protein
MWKQRRAFVWRTYDARNFEEWSSTKEKSPSKQYRIKPEARQVLWGPGTVAREMYDTYEHAITLGVVSEAGLCMTCGGKRTPKRCKCDPDAPPEAPDDSPGMLRWREVHAARLERLRAAGTPLPPAPDPMPDLIEIPETDETPGVLVDTSAT